MSTIIVQNLELAETFQETFLMAVFQAIKRSESGVIIGPPGMGKSLVLGLLQNDHIKNLYLPSEKLSCVFLDLSQNLPDFPIPSSIPGSKLVIIGDNAESLESENNQGMIQKLNSVREKFRPHVSLILAAEKNIIENHTFCENLNFCSILLENILYLPPLNEGDAKSFAKGIAKQIDFKIKESQLAEIVANGHGAPRIIKRLVKLTQIGKNPTTDPKLRYDSDVLTSFKKSHPDYPYLDSFTKDEPISSQDQVGNLHLNAHLTKLEVSLAKTLLAASGQIVQREDMIKAIWPNNYYDTSEHALDQMIHRLKKKLESATPKCELITLRGRGVKLISA